jgi:hypothetical protein
MSDLSDSDSISSDSELISLTKSEIEGVSSLLQSISVLHENVFKKLKESAREEADLIKQFRVSSTSIDHILKVTLKKVKKVVKNIDKFQIVLDDKDSEIEKIEENHAFVQNDLERSCKIHKEDKKLLLPLSFKIVQYTSLMSNNVGGDSKCSTCLEDYTDTTLLAELGCGHFFHKECALKWMSENKSECSLCKTHVTGKTSIWKKRKLPFTINDSDLFLSEIHAITEPTMNDQDATKKET